MLSLLPSRPSARTLKRSGQRSGASLTIGGGNSLLTVRPFTAPEPFRRVALAWRVTYPRSGAIDVIRAAILDSPLQGVKPVGRGSPLPVG